MKYLGLVFACLLFFSAFAYVRPAHAEVSSGCAAINGWTESAGLGDGPGFATNTYFEGEVITVTATLATGATKAYGDLVLNDVTVLNQFPVPGVVSYTIPADGEYLVQVFNDPFLDGDGWIDFVVTCHGDEPESEPESVPGPGVPSGFVLRTITCDVPVYTLPGGTVTSATIKNGQTWFVSPTPVMDSAGAAWTEIFVGSYVNGFIPTECVGG